MTVLLLPAPITVVIRGRGDEAADETAKAFLSGFSFIIELVSYFIIAKPIRIVITIALLMRPRHVKLKVGK